MNENLSADPGLRLRVSNLGVSLAGVGGRITSHVSFDLRAGEILALVGESGSGKTVTATALMRLLSGALEVTTGQVELDGTNLLTLTESQMRRVRGGRMAMIFQNPMTSLNPVRKVGQQLAEALRLHTFLRGRALRRRVLELLGEVGLADPGQYYGRYPHEFSGGQQQRVMIAMALAAGPDVLIADEPTSALDLISQNQILRLIRELSRSRKLAVLLITHDLGLARQAADEIGVMLDGTIVERSSARQFFSSPVHPFSRLLVGALAVAPLAPAETSDSRALLELREVKAHIPIRRGILQRVVDHFPAVDGVSLSIGRGECYALVGESGSGKSTLGRVILNLQPVTGGGVYVDGAPVHRLPARALIPYRRRIQAVFQDPQSSMNPRLTIGATIAEGMVSLGLERPGRACDARVEDLLHRVQLQPVLAHRYPHELSGGQLQRVAIARALAVQPELIICDEITSALDASIRIEVLELLRSLQRNSGVAFLFISHDLALVPSMADRVGVMRRGTLVEQGSTEQVFNRPAHPYTRELLAAIPVPGTSR